MRLETRRRVLTSHIYTADVLLIAETEDESRILDQLGNMPDPDGLICRGEYELRLADGYADNYVMLKGARLLDNRETDTPTEEDSD